MADAPFNSPLIFPFDCSSMRSSKFFVELKLPIGATSLAHKIFKEVFMAIGAAGNTAYPIIVGITESVLNLELMLPDKRSEDGILQTDSLGDIPEPGLEAVKNDTPDIPPAYQDVWRRYSVLCIAAQDSLARYSSFMGQLTDLKALIESQGALNKKALSLQERTVVVLSEHDKTKTLSIQAEVKAFDEGNHDFFDVPTQRIIQDILDQIGEELKHQPASI